MTGVVSAYLGASSVRSQNVPRKGPSPGNDYQMMCAAGCRLYAAYASPHAGSWDIYVRVITLPDPNSTCDCVCTADVDGDSAVTTNDLATYMSARTAGASLADVNRDQAVNSQDDVQFMNALSQALNQP